MNSVPPLSATPSERYKRHLLLEPIGERGQAHLLAARVLIIGLGGLGSASSLYLASAGIGTLLLADDDRVELSNLQRQIVHTEARIGQLKVASAQQALHAINSDIAITPLAERMTEERLHAVISDVDLVLDCCDNFATRQLINRVCWQAHKPWVSAAINGFNGQLSVYDFRQRDVPCYHCLYPAGNTQIETRAPLGVFAPLVGCMGSMQAVEAVKLVCAAGQAVSQRVLLYDALHGEWRAIKLTKNPHCAVCQSSDNDR